MEKKDRKKILILEHDDFLREILGNLLHKKGYYIISDHNIEKGISEARNEKIDLVILGTSCFEYKGKETLSFIKKMLGEPELMFFMINDTHSPLPFIEKDYQIITTKLSIRTIMDTIEKMLMLNPLTK